MTLSSLQTVTPLLSHFRTISLAPSIHPHCHTLTIFVPIGKVHGSLARAGKVRGQTPKVEKSEPGKKKPKGRAFKRQQYNR